MKLDALACKSLLASVNSKFREALAVNEDGTFTDVKHLETFFSNFINKMNEAGRFICTDHVQLPARLEIKILKYKLSLYDALEILIEIILSDYFNPRDPNHVEALLAAINDRIHV